MFPVLPKQEISMHTRDGVRLDADVYYPDGEGPFPVLLMRQPYGRAIASTVVYAPPSWYAAHGYIVVIQDTRGHASAGGRHSRAIGLLLRYICCNRGNGSVYNCSMDVMLLSYSSK